jgi:hypothetical protein
MRRGNDLPARVHGETPTPKNKSEQDFIPIVEAGGRKANPKTRSQHSPASGALRTPYFTVYAAGYAPQLLLVIPLAVLPAN